MKNNKIYPKKKVHQMSEEEFEAYLDDVSRQVQEMTTEEAIMFTLAPIETQNRDQRVTYGDEEATTI